MDFVNQQVLVFGTGKSGLEATKLLLEKGSEVILFDGNEIDVQKIIDGFHAHSDLKVHCRELPEEYYKTLSLVILSPGVPTDLPLVEALRERRIPIWGEVELAFACGKGNILAITGTNGKTTTTALLGEIVKGYKENVFVVGNIGIPYTGIVTQTTEESTIVAELSSFQLETIHSFHPRVSAILNLTPDHLNRHHTMEAYSSAKKRITLNQDGRDVCILNYDDQFTREFGEELDIPVLYFSSSQVINHGMYLDKDEIVYRDEKEEQVICKVQDLQILGVHNIENAMAAALMAYAYGVPFTYIRKGLLAFAGVPHRIERVRELAGVTYYNDSKATNPDAAIRGIDAMNCPTYLIGGGYDKDSDYTEWLSSFDGKVKLLVLLGATREKIASQAKAIGFTDIVFVESLEEAVDICSTKACNGEAVLLSPACASWGMFRDFEERGDQFKELVMTLS